MLNTNLNRKYYKSDDIEHGRVVVSFFEKFTTEVFNKVNKFYVAHEEWTGESFLPLLNNERMSYSLMAAAIDELTPVHMSEVSFNLDESRRVDQWCLYKNKENGKALNFFIEIKHGYYCVSEGTQAAMTVNLSNKFDDLVKQLLNLKKDIKPDWTGDGNAYLGINVVYGYHSENKSIAFDEKTILDDLSQSIDNRHGIQIVSNTWFLPDDMNIQWEKSKCNFISIIGLVLTKKTS